MTLTPQKASDVPADERPRPQPEDEPRPSGDVKEPPSPATSGTEEKFPRKGDVPI
jgi:hypothetical protein